MVASYAIFREAFRRLHLPNSARRNTGSPSVMFLVVHRNSPSFALRIEPQHFLVARNPTFSLDGRLGRLLREKGEEKGEKRQEAIHDKHDDR